MGGCAARFHAAKPRMTIADFWPQCLRQLQQQLSAQQYRMWIEQLTVGEDNGQWQVYAANNFMYSHIRQQFWPQILQIHQQLLPAGSPPLCLSIGRGQLLTAEPVAAETPVVPARPPAAPDPVGKNTDALSIIGKHLNKTAPSVNNHTSPAEASGNAPAAKSSARSQLQPEFTFDTLVIGKGNEVAVAAAHSIVDNPGGRYNPLYLYSSPGLGKTHLVQAIGNALLQKNPKAKVAYMHADHYVRGVMSAARNDGFDAFKQKYKPYDLLILDDVQFIADKTRTMEEFFYLFNHFQDEKKQIILTGDTLPDNINKLDNRLQTRFKQGLTLPLEPPELEMRAAILMKKAELNDVALDEMSALLIAKLIRGSVRDLEGAFKRVEAHARFTGKPISIDLINDALHDLVASAHRAITPEMIMDAVGKYYQVSLSDLLSKKRTAAVSHPRQMAMALTKELTSLSLPAIAKNFGGRDHTTVMHAIKQVDKRRQEDPEVVRDYQKLQMLIKN